MNGQGQLDPIASWGVLRLNLLIAVKSARVTEPSPTG